MHACAYASTNRVELVRGEVQTPQVHHGAPPVPFQNASNSLRTWCEMTGPLSRISSAGNFDKVLVESQILAVN